MTANGRMDAALYRCVPEKDVVELLRLAGFAYDTDSQSVSLTILNALKAWREAGLAFQSGPGGRLYDPAEVVNFLKRLGLSGADSFWQERYVKTGRKLVTDLADLGSGCGFHVSFVRTFAHTPSAGRGPRLRVPLPLSDYGETSSLQMQLPADARSRLDDGRLEVSIGQSGPTRIALAFDYAPREVKPSDEDLGLYLRPKEGLIVVTRRITDLASSLTAKGQMSGLESVRAFWDFIFDRFICGVVHYDQVDLQAPGDWVLSTGLYDCQLGSALLIALCRSIGLPARMIGGHVLYGCAPTNHFWAEVYLDGNWVAFDLLSWDLSLGGKDLEWRYHFFGRVDPRLVTQRLPHQFTGPIGVKIPTAWYMLQHPLDAGIAISLNGLDGAVVYSDEICVSAMTGLVKA